MIESTERPLPPTPSIQHTHKGRKYILREEGDDFTCNTAEMFSFGPNPTIAKEAWSSSTSLLYAHTRPPPRKKN
jgi:hypothetical protein